MPLSTEQGTAGPKGPSDPPAGQPTPDRLLVATAFAQLPAEYRAVLRRSFYQHWTTAQIAGDLRIAESTVTTRLHFALQALRSTLQELVANATTPTPAAFGTALPCRWNVNRTGELRHTR